VTRNLPIYTDSVRDLRPFADVRLVAIDLDGTLVPAELSRRVQSLIRSLRRRSVVVTLATGRTLAGVEALGRTLELASRTPLILYNGSAVVEARTHRILHQRRIPSTTVESITALADKHALAVLAYFLSDPVTDLAEIRGELEKIIGWTRDTELPRRLHSDFNEMPIQWQAEPLRHDVPGPSAVLLPIPSDTPVGILDGLASAIGQLPGVDVTRSGATYLEVRPAGSNKGEALRAVASSLDIPLADTMAVGDNDNDAEMLGAAGIGISVAGASAKALANSDFVSRHGTFSGVVESLKVVQEAKRYFRVQRKERGKR